MTTQNLDSSLQPLEQRVAVLEAELAQLKQKWASPESHPWWEHVFGVFTDCPAFDEMEQFGKEWRNNPPDDME